MLNKTVISTGKKRNKDANVLFLIIPFQTKKSASANFLWPRTHDNSHVRTRQVIDFLKGPEELEMLSFPAGAILRLRRVRHSALYTCRVAYGNKHTDIQVPRLLQLLEERSDS